MVNKKRKQSSGSLIIPREFGVSSKPGFAWGQVVRSKAGRDKDHCYLVVGRAGDTLYLADGRARGIDNPKKKNIRHVQKFNRVAADRVEQALDRQFRDEEIRAVLRELTGE